MNFFYFYEGVFDINEHKSLKLFFNIENNIFRPVNNVEKASKSPLVVDVASSKEVIVRERPQDKLTKKFTFDKVFGPVSKQVCYIHS